MALGEAGRIEGMMFPLGRYMARDLTSDDIALLDDFIISNKDFFETLSPNWATEYTGEKFLNMSSGGAKSENRHFWGVFDGPKLIAVTDLISNFPMKGSWSIGHFIIEKSCRLKGFGVYIYNKIQNYIRLNSDCASIRITVQTSNTVAVQFWKLNGFETVKTIKQEIAGRYHEAAVMEAMFY